MNTTQNEVQPDENGQEYVIKLRRSPIPFWVTGIVWLLYAIAFPMYLWYHYLIVAALSAGAYALTAHFFPARQVRVPKPHTLILSGITDVDKIIREADGRLRSITESGKAIRDPKMQETVLRLSGCAYKILDYVAENSKQLPQLRRFFNYYLPTLNKLLISYRRLERHGMDGANVTASEQEIRKAVCAMETLFSHQLDKLFRDTALDVSTDVDVLEAMLQSDGIRKTTGTSEKTPGQE